MLVTKLRVPDLAPHVAPRPRLLQRLAGWTTVRLLLVTAPAGYGKTTLVSAWAHVEFGPRLGAVTRKERTAMRTPPALASSAFGALSLSTPPLSTPPLSTPPLSTPPLSTPPLSTPADGARHLGWLSLDEGDNDPQQFVRYLAAALEPAIPDIAAAVQQLLAGAQASTTQAASALINALARTSDEVLLVLDGYHCITDPAVHALMGLLLEHGPPNFHCLIATRQTPPLAISRIRGRKQLLELRREELKFTAEEAGRFFADELPNHRLTPQDLTELAERTEGWAVSMQLTALALREHHERRPAPTPGQDFFAAYVVAEVLDRQPAAVRTFMLRTAILDVLSAPLCAAVTRQEDAAAQLAYLAQVTALVAPVAAEQGIYRYHDVLRDVLLQQLALHASPEEAAELHRRAAAWYEERGDIDAALRYCRAAGDEAAMADLIERQCLPALLRGEVQAATRWLAQAPAAALFERPRLALDDAWLSIVMERSDLEEKLARVRLAIARSLPPEVANHPWQQELLGLEAGAAMMSGNPAAARELSLRCIATAAQGQSMALGTCHLIQLTLRRYTGPLAEVHEHAAAAFQAFTHAGFVLGQISAQRTLALCLFESGKPAQAMDYFQRVLELIRRRAAGQISEAAETRIAFGVCLYVLNAIDDAAEQFEAALAIGRAVDDPAWTLLATIWLKRCARAQNPWLPVDLAGADEEEALWRQVGAQRAASLQLQTTVARTLRWLGEGESARAWQAIGAVHFNPNSVPALAQIRLVPVYVHVHLALGKSAGAILPAFQRWEAFLDANSWSGFLKIQFRIAAACLSEALGNRATAAKALDEALALIAATGYVRPIFDRLDALRPLLLRSQHPLAQQILAEAKQAVRHPAAPVLSAIELCVLRLAAQNHTNKQIAVELEISNNTVKFHLKRIFAKLAVESRKEAVTKATELGLLW